MGIMLAKQGPSLAYDGPGGKSNQLKCNLCTKWKHSALECVEIKADPETNMLGEIPQGSGGSRANAKRKARKFDCFTESV